MNDMITELGKQKLSLKEISSDLDSIGDKVVSVDQLKSILAKLEAISKINTLITSLKSLQDTLAQKEIDCN
jgi:hypothetical protein